MKTALITTAINVPTVLELYRQHGPDVRFFVAGDKGGPHAEIEDLANRIGGYFLYLDPSAQTKWKCSELIGWNCVQRRAIATLEAYRWGADVIVSVDTDDLPIAPDHFLQIARGIERKFSGIELRSQSGWVDPGWLIGPATSHRGMPVRLDRFYAHPAIDRDVGVVASTVLGSCDLSAVDRIPGLLKRHTAAELARHGVIVDPKISWTLFNSEAVAYRRELAPAMMVLPHVQRYDDLFASMVTQRVMAERGWCVRLGPPAVWHEREDRNVLNDLANELYGMQHILQFAAWLEAIPLHGDSVLADVRTIWECTGVLPDKMHEAALAWCDDYERLGA
jgi:hypothetical protein